MTEPEPRTITKTDWLLLGLLFALVLPLRGWLLHNTEVTARDSIGYIRYALQFEEYSWKKVLMKNHQHPGYPALVWLASVPVRAIDGETTPENMRLSTQLVSFIASLILLVPMYFLGRQFFPRTICFWATLLYQYLPISAHHLSDGISEPTYLVFLVSGLLQMVQGIRDRNAWRCAACGLFTGLAYLTRPEGALILPAFGSVLIATQVYSALRAPWPRFLACGSAMTLTAMLVGSVYVAATGKLTTKPSPLATMKLADAGAIPSPTEVAVGPLFAATFVPSDQRLTNLQHSAWALFMEVAQGFHYAAIVPALLGLWWTFPTLRQNPGFWALAVYTALHSFILIRLAMSVSYISDRHVMILVLCGCYFVIVGLSEFPCRVLAFWTSESSPSIRPWYRSASLLFAMLLIAMFGSCLPKATQRLHGNRAANHEAGIWLGKQLKVGDHVEDDHSWSLYFSGFMFREGEIPVLPVGYVPTCYVVATRSNDSEIEAKRQGDVAADARIVYHWPERLDIGKARVVVYAQPRDPKKNPWHIARTQ